MVALDQGSRDISAKQHLYSIFMEIVCTAASLVNARVFREEKKKQHLYIFQRRRWNNIESFFPNFIASIYRIN